MSKFERKKWRESKKSRTGENREEKIEKEKHSEKGREKAREKKAEQNEKK